MITSEIDLLALLNAYGIAILAPLAIIEGPIVTVIAAWLASLGLLNLWEVLICVILADLVGDSLISCGFTLRSQVIWAKERFALSRGDYHWQHEPCWYAVREGKAGHWAGRKGTASVMSRCNPVVLKVRLRRRSDSNNPCDGPIAPIESNAACRRTMRRPGIRRSRYAAMLISRR